MDTDLENMSREQLIIEVQKLRQGIRAHPTVRATNCVGITRHYGHYCRSNPIRFLSYLIGRNSCKVASSTANRSTSKRRKHPEVISHFATERRV